MDYFDYLLEPENKELDLEELLKESTEQERNRLTKELGRIEAQLRERDKLHESFVNELRSKIDWYKDRLEKAYKQGQKVEAEELKQDITQFYRELRKEKRNNWRDKQELEQEKRKIIRELAELDNSFLEELL